MRRHDRSDDQWRQCWHDLDREDAHALYRHHWCLPGDALPLPDDDPHGLYFDHDDAPDACRWVARWRTRLLTLAPTLPDDRPLGVVLLDPVGGLVRLSSHTSYRDAGPARTRAGRRPADDGMAEAKARAIVLCLLGHLH
ncbi:hypothetical protein [Phycicoccus ginsengisoli]